MSIVDHNQAIQVPYSLEDTFTALKSICSKLSGFSVDKFDETLKIAYLKAGVSLFSWGENVNVTVTSSQSGGSEISILSTPKTGILFGGANDMGKNRKNINTIMSALSEELKKYTPEKLQNSTSVEIVADEIKKLAELKNQGILTEDEFSQKKKQLLNL